VFPFVARPFNFYLFPFVPSRGGPRGLAKDVTLSASSIGKRHTNTSFFSEFVMNVCEKDEL
jgi:hypothetical protein